MRPRPDLAGRSVDRCAFSKAFRLGTLRCPDRFSTCSTLICGTSRIVIEMQPVREDGRKSEILNFAQLQFRDSRNPSFPTRAAAIAPASLYACTLLYVYESRRRQKVGARRAPEKIFHDDDDGRTEPPKSKPDRSISSAISPAKRTESAAKAFT